MSLMGRGYGGGSTRMELVGTVRKGPAGWFLHIEKGYMENPSRLVGTDVYLSVPDNLKAELAKLKGKRTMVTGERPGVCNTPPITLIVSEMHETW